MPTASSDLIESPAQRRYFTRRSVVLVAGAAVIVASAAVAVTLRPGKVEQPKLPGWPAAGARATDNQLRETAWRAWANRDLSVALERTATLFADEWRQGNRTVVVLATQDQVGVRIAVVLVDGQEAETFGTRSLPTDTKFITEVVEAGGQTAVLVLAPGMRSTVVSTAVPGAPRATETEATAEGGVLVPVAAGQTATRVVLKDHGGTVLADRVPGADLYRMTPPLPLIVSETAQGGRRVQIRSDGGGVTCRVVLADPETEAPALVECPPTA